MPATRPDTQARRRAATRERIVAAGTRLFEARGYSDVSIGDISAEAGIAARTIYLHFDSKAAILLAYFDDWIDNLIAAVCLGPPDEPLGDAVVRAYGILDRAGKVDHRTFDQMDSQHPIIELFASNNLDIPGHVLQSWVHQQDRLVEHFRTAPGLAPDSVIPRARAAAFFATWMVTLLSYRDARDGAIDRRGPFDDVAAETMRLFSTGVDDSR